MYEKLFEQSERLFKPFSEIWALQAQAAETLAKTHTTVMTEAWNQGVLALQNIPAQKNVEDVFKLQQAYWENMQESLQEMFDGAQGVIMETNRKISAVLQQSTDSATNAVSTAFEPVVPAKASGESVADAMTATQSSTTSVETPITPSKSTFKPTPAIPAKAAVSHGGKSAESTRPAVESEAKTDGKSASKNDGKTQATRSTATKTAAKKSHKSG